MNFSNELTNKIINKMDINNINTEIIIDFLEDKKISGYFEGVDICLYTSLEEYNFIYSSKLKIAIYKNSLNNFDILLGYSNSEIFDYYKDFFDMLEIEELASYLSFVDLKNISFYKENIPLLFLDFNLYYGIEESLFSLDYYNNGIKDFEEFKSIISKHLKKEEVFYA